MRRRALLTFVLLSALVAGVFRSVASQSQPLFGRNIIAQVHAGSQPGNEASNPDGDAQHVTLFTVFAGFRPTVLASVLPGGRREQRIEINVVDFDVPDNNLQPTHRYTLLGPSLRLFWWIEELDAGKKRVRLFHPNTANYDPANNVIVLAPGNDAFQMAKGHFVNVYAYAQENSGEHRKGLLPTFEPAMPADISLEITGDAVPAPIFTFQPGFPRRQKMESGASRTVVPFQFNFEHPALLPNLRAGRLYFETRNALSTESMDLSTQVEVGFGFEGDFITFPATGRNPRPFISFIQPTARLRYLSNQSFSNQTLDLRAGLAASVSAFAIPRNNLIRNSLGPLVSVTPLWYAHRLRRNLAVIPSHAQYDVLGTAAEIDWQPIFLFVPGKRAPVDLEDKFAALKLNGKLWAFYNEQAVPGFKTRSFETCGDVELQIPIHLGKATPLKTWMIVFYGDGANEANGFARSTQLGAAIRIADFRLGF